MGESIARAAAVQPNGRLVLAGSAIQPFGGGCCAADFALARLTTTGTLDSSFGGDGRVVTDFMPGADNGQDAAHAVLVRADGRILAAGSGVAGAGSVDLVGYQDEIRDLAVDPGGRIVTGGQSCSFPGDFDEVCDFGLVRYTSGARWTNASAATAGSVPTSAPLSAKASAGWSCSTTGASLPPATLRALEVLTWGWPGIAPTAAWTAASGPTGRSSPRCRPAPTR